MAPLDNIKVLDFTQAAGGPFGSQMLGDMGADVIKIEPLSGDHFRFSLKGVWIPTLNRNKRSIAINLKDTEGRKAILNLAEKADVLFESFVPGTMDGLGLGYEVIEAVNPGIIYCSLTGYGQKGLYRQRAGYDVCAQAESGLMAATGEEGRPHVRIGASVVDYGTGMFAAYGITLALLERQKTGRGQYIDVSLLDTAVTFMNYWYTYYYVTGEDPPRMGTGHLNAVPYQVFEASDRPVFVGVSTNKFWETFCDLFNLNHLAGDPRFATNAGRVKNREQLVPLLQEVLRQYDSAELTARLNSGGIPCAIVMKVSEAVEDPHIKENILVETDCRNFGRLKIPGIPVRLSDTPGEIKRPGPLLGEHTVEILKETGYSDDEINQLIEKKVILQHER